LRIWNWNELKMRGWRKWHKESWKCILFKN